IGLPTGPADAVPRSCAFTSSGPCTGRPRPPPSSTSAAAPLVIAALNDVPEPTKFDEPTRAVGNKVSIVESGARRLTTERPDVPMSGLNQPSMFVGPTLLKSAIVAAVGSVEPLSSRDPMVIASGSSPGDRIVPLNGPALPAETTTVMPAFHAASTARSS